MDVGERIKDLRERAGEKQEFIAKYLRQSGFKKASRQLISAIETGKQYPNIKMLIALADHFSVSVDFLLGRISYTTDRDRQFEQFMLMYREDMEDQPIIVREYFNTSMNETYWILSRIRDYGPQKILSRFSEIFSKLRVSVYKATELSDTIKSDASKNDVNKLLPNFKYIHSETLDILKEIASVIDDLAIPIENLPKISEFEAFADIFNKLNFDEE